MKKTILTIAADVLGACLVLLVFAFFHHVLPSLKAKSEIIPVPVLPQTTAEVFAEPQITQNEEQKTEWQIKFADRFTEETVFTDHSYTSPNISINIETVTRNDMAYSPVTYYVADIYIASIDCLKTRLAHGEYSYFDNQNVLEMDKDADAILSIGGDFATYQNNAFLVRNGKLLFESNKTWGNLCALYNNGVMQCYNEYRYNHDEILSRGAWQVWDFGPILLDDSGNIFSNYTASSYVLKANPRSSIGYYEPGHYCFVVVDGRQEHSVGVYLNELAEIFHDLGCTQAYNLDGGGSAVMLFNHSYFSSQSNPSRELGDIIYIAEP